MFKIGDKVKVIKQTNGWGDVRENDIGIVNYVGKTDLSVDFPNQKQWLGSFECFVLYKNYKIRRI